MYFYHNYTYMCNTNDLGFHNSDQTLCCKKTMVDYHDIVHTKLTSHSDYVETKWKWEVLINGITSMNVVS